jgi:hypothetical protein
MTRQTMFRAGLLVLALATAIPGASSASRDSGRYKKQGDRCVWDAGDSGPNQCTPVTAGHFRKQGDSCVWVANATGTNQCRPPKGRFKSEGSACVWNGDDSGPDQCDPHKAK